MKPISTDIRNFLFACVIVGVAGLGGLGWIHARLQTAQVEARRLADDLINLKCGLPENSESIRQNQQIAREVLQQLQPILSSWCHTPQPATPETWKQTLNAKIHALNALAPEPRDFYYGFSDFRQNTPDTAQIPALDIQLFAVERLCNMLFADHASRLQTILRAPTGKNEKSDLLDARITASSWYDAYPFEVEFFCKPDALRNFLNRLVASDLFWIPRAIVVENTHQPREVLKNRLKEKGDRPFFVISGDEDIRVKLRLDLLLVNPAKLP